MTLLDDILAAIGITNNLEITQNFSFFSCKGKLVSPNRNIATDLKNVLLPLSTQKLFILISIKIGQNDAIKFTTESLNAFEERAEELFDDCREDEEIIFEIESTNWDGLYIFHLESFINHISKITLADTLKGWSKICVNGKFIIHVLADHLTYSNDYFYISSHYPNNDLTSYKNWETSIHDSTLINEKIECRDKVGHFVDAAQYHFTPECFSFNDTFALRGYFDHLKSIFSLIFLSDYSNIDGNTLRFKIKGYKTLNCTLDYKLSNDIESEIYSLYEWVYCDGPFVDKIGIARNVISIHITNEDISTLEKGTCNSAQSGYDLYLKDNIKQYIEIKNKISDMLYTQSEKASGIVKDMFAMFKTSMWTFTSFFLLSFLAKVIGGTTSAQPSLLSIISNTSILVIGLLLIFFSFIYLVFARHEVSDEIKRLTNKYAEIENRYKDLLNEEDLKKILKQSSVDGKTAQEIELSYIKLKKRHYSCYWLTINLLLLFIIVSPYLYTEITNNFPALKNIFIQGKLIISRISFC